MCFVRSLRARCTNDYLKHSRDGKEMLELQQIALRRDIERRYFHCQCMSGAARCTLPVARASFATIHLMKSLCSLQCFFFFIVCIMLSDACKASAHRRYYNQLTLVVARDEYSFITLPARRLPLHVHCHHHFLSSLCDAMCRQQVAFDASCTVCGGVYTPDATFKSHRNSCCSNS